MLIKKSVLLNIPAMYFKSVEKAFLEVNRCCYIFEQNYKLQLSGRQRLPDNVHQLHVQRPSTYAKPEAASAVLGF
jgi:hypothetical protein